MPREMVTVRQLDLEGNLTGQQERELMVRRPRDKAAYAVLPGNTHRPLVSDNPPTLEVRPPRPVQVVNLRTTLEACASAAAASGRSVRVIGMFDAD